MLKITTILLLTIFIGACDAPLKQYELVEKDGKTYRLNRITGSVSLISSDGDRLTILSETKAPERLNYAPGRILKFTDTIEKGTLSVDVKVKLLAGRAMYQLNAYPAKTFVKESEPGSKDELPTPQELKDGKEKINDNTSAENGTEMGESTRDFHWFEDLENDTYSNNYITIVLKDGDGFKLAEKDIYVSRGAVRTAKKDNSFSHYSIQGEFPIEIDLINDGSFMDDEWSLTIKESRDDEVLGDKESILLEMSKNLSVLQRLYALRGSVVTDLRAELTSGELKFKTLQEEYNSLGEQYRRLLRPARSPAGKYVVDVYFAKQAGKLVYRMREPDQAEPIVVSRDELETRLGALKEEYQQGLYTKVRIDDKSGIGFNEAWVFTEKILSQYDYYSNDFSELTPRAIEEE